MPSDEVTYHRFGTAEDFAVYSHPLLCHFELEKVFNSRSTCLYVPPVLSEDRNVSETWREKWEGAFSFQIVLYLSVLVRYCPGADGGVRAWAEE